MPSPVDLRIWFLSRVMGWPGRRIANEVGVSQSTVVRTLDHLQKEPPTDQEMTDFVTVTSNTPPKGVPVLRTTRPVARPLMLALTAAVMMIALALTVVLIAFAVHILTH